MMPGQADEQAARAGTCWSHAVVLGIVCALVMGVYAWSARSGLLELCGSGAADSYYNLLVRGFQSGQLNLKREAPAALAQLPDPYDAKASEPYRLDAGCPLHDLSLYQGKLYLYHGVTPALVLFWPYVTLTGQYLLHKQAAWLFFSTGFLAGAGLLWAMWRRYFADVGFGVAVAGTLALGLASFAPAILQRSDVYEVAIGCGHALAMLALVGIWGALHAARQRIWWLAGASLAYGLALGARPSLLFGAVILLAPVVLAWRQKSFHADGSNAEASNCPLTPSLSPSEGERVPKAGEEAIVKNPGTRTANSRRVWPLWIAAFGPITIVGLGLMLYNLLRFGDPFEFGQRYQLSGYRQSTMQQFSLHYLGFNFRVAFLEPARWSGRFPFVHDAALPALPRGYFETEHSFGLLTNIPLVWLALAAPLAWRRRPEAARSTMRGFAAAVAVLFGTCALVLGLHNSMCLRYEVEFAAPLVWLAVLGVFGLERALAGRPAWRNAARCAWGLLLAFSVAFSLLAGMGRQADAYFQLANARLGKGGVSEAIAQYQTALRINPDFVEAHNNLGNALLEVGRGDEAIVQFGRALELQPRLVTARFNLGNALLRKGDPDAAIAEFQKAIEIEPAYAMAHINLGTALRQRGRVNEAIAQYTIALGIQPGSAEAHYNLGNALIEAGRQDEALLHYQRAVEIKPDYAEAYNNLGNVLLEKGRTAEAIAHFTEALRLKPDYAAPKEQLRALGVGTPE